MRGLMKERFASDLLVVVILTVLLGAFVAKGVAFAVNIYLGQQVTGVLGDLGEYDLILHVREESSDAAEVEIQRVISSDFKEVGIKKGPIVLGKSNFFIGLPDHIRSRSTLENLAKALTELPGASGVTFIIEPRLTLTGVEPGAFHIILSEAEKIDGVRFCFRDGGRIAVLLKPDADMRQVSNDLTALIERYRLIEVRFPVGYEMEDSVGSGEAYIKKLLSSAGAGFARDITRRGGNQDLADLFNTLTEMKRFLRNYSAYADISITDNTILETGDTVLLLPWEDPTSKKTQDIPKEDGLLAVIEKINNGTVQGMVIQGDTGDISEPNLKVFSVDRNNKAKDYIGTAVVVSESKKIGYAVDESIRLLYELEEFRGNAYLAAINTLDILGMYDETIDRLINVQRALEISMESLGRTSDRTVGRQETAALEKAIAGAMGIMDSLESAVRGIDTFETQAKQIIEILSLKEDELHEDIRSYGEVSTELQEKIYMVSNLLDLAGIKALERAKAIDEFVESARPVTSQLIKWKSDLESLFRRISGIRQVLATDQAGQIISEMMDATNNVLIQAQAMDIPSMERAINEAAKNLEAVKTIDTEAIIRELQEVKASLPKLRDDEVGRSICLIDRYIGGEVIPGDSLQVMVDKSTDQNELKVLAREMFGKEVRVYTGPIGFLEPGVRGEVYRVLREARASITAIVLIIVTLFALILDHAAVISAMKEFNSGLGVIYSVIVGTVILISQFIITGAKVPYVSHWHVAGIGALLGFITATQSNKISPLPKDELIAGIVMGLTYTQIMREIVVPSSRPGLLSLLNKPKTVLRLKRRGDLGDRFSFRNTKPRCAGSGNPESIKKLWKESGSIRD